MIKLLVLILLLVACAKVTVKRETVFDFKDFDKVSEQSSQKSNIKRVLIITDDFFLENQVSQLDQLFRNIAQTEVITLAFCDFNVSKLAGRFNTQCGYFFRSFLQNMSRGLKTKEYELKDYLDFYRPQFLYFIFKNSPESFPPSFKDMIAKYNLTCFKTEVPSNKVVKCSNELSFSLEKVETLEKEISFSLQYNNVPYIRMLYQNFNEAINSVPK